MAHPRVLSQNGTALIVVDIQEAFRPVLERFDDLVKNAVTAVRGFAILDRPIIVTEQYPRGLGHTAKELLHVLKTDMKSSKRHRSVLAVPGN